jgi:hypothetical protein
LVVTEVAKLCRGEKIRQRLRLRVKKVKAGAK